MEPTDIRHTPLRAHRKVIFICLLFSLANAQYGFDSSVIASFQAMRGFLQVFGYRDPKLPAGWGIETTAQQLITSFMNVGTMFGVLFTAPFSRYFGRREGIWMGTVIGFIGSGVQIGAETIPALCVGRFLIGASNAFFFTFANAYLVEVAPPSLRGPCSSLLSLMAILGTTLGTLVSFGTKNIEGRLSYHIGLACIFIFPTVLSVGCFFVPESPRWLLVKGRDERAERALESLRPKLTREMIREEFVEMQRGIEEEKARASTSVLDAFKGADLKRTLICIGTYTSRAASGLWVFIAYGTYYFQQAGISDPFGMQLVNNFLGMAATAVAIFISYRYAGRRTIILGGTAGAVVCMGAAAIGGSAAANTPEAAKNFVAWMILFSVTYAAFASTLTWPVTAEVCSSRLRIVTLSIATAIDYVFAWLVAFCSPYFINPTALNWGIKYCWIWAGSNILTFVFFYFLLPEMKGRSLEEIDEMFEARVPIRQFAKYECRCTAEAHAIVTDDKVAGAAVAETVEDVPQSKAVDEKIVSA